MKPIILACALVTIGVAHGQDAEAGRDRWAREFTVDAPKILDPPFTGILQGVWPKDNQKYKHEKVRLDVLRPADSGAGHSPIDTP